MPPTGEEITPGEVYRIVEKMQETLENIWREIKEIRAGFLPLREFESYAARTTKEIERTAREAREQITNAANSLRRERDGMMKILDQRIEETNDHVADLRRAGEQSASKRFTVLSGLGIAIGAAVVGAVIAALLGAHL